MKKKAFTLVEVLIVVAILGLLAMVGIPSFLHSQQGANDDMKEIHISSVEAAKRQWAIMNNKPPGSTVTWDNIEGYIDGGVSKQSNLDVDGDSIILNPVGTRSSY